MTVPAHVYDPAGPLPTGRMLIEASAGTGKTHAIASLVARLVAEEGLAIDRVLVVTFTEAAAAELRGRVRRRLMEVLHACDVVARGNTCPDDATARAVATTSGEEGSPHPQLAERQRRLRQALRRFDDATIDTIHGFCRQVLQQAGPALGTVADGELTGDVADLVARVVRDRLVAALRDADPGWYETVASGSFEQDLVSIAKAVEAEPKLLLLPDDIDTDIGTPDGARSLLGETTGEICRRWHDQRDRIVDWIGTTAEEKGFGKGQRTFSRAKAAAARDAIDVWCRAVEADSAGTPLAGTEAAGPELVDADHAGTGSHAEVSADAGRAAELFDAFARAKIEAKLAEGRAIPVELDIVDASAMAAEAQARIVGAFRRRIVLETQREVTQRKRQSGLWSFSDLLNSLETALSDPGTRRRLTTLIRQRFDAALIDEFHDTDQVQWNIFSTAFDGDARLYLVGDPKQAIYAFRGADVHTYLAASRTVPEDARFTLTTNHRSDARYLTAVNRMFGREGFDADGVYAVPGIRHIDVEASEANQTDRLDPADATNPALELRVVTRTAAGLDDAAAGKPITKDAARRLICADVAAGVVEFLASKTRIRGGSDMPWRVVQPSDIAVLTRTNREATDIQRALHDHGVPAVVRSDASVLASPQARAVEWILAALLDPGSLRAVRGAMATDVLARPASVFAGDPAAVERDAERFASWSELFHDRGVAVALARIFADEDAAARLAGTRRGERALTNLVHLTEILHRAESELRLGPHGLMTWFRGKRREPPSADDAFELRLESDDDAVQVVTVHRAKGLQYSVVWCPFLWDDRLPRRGDPYLRLHDPESGRLALDLHVDRGREPGARNFARAVEEDWQESLRTMYVALTRARHRTILHTGAFNGMAPAPSSRLLYGSHLDNSGTGTPTASPDPASMADDEHLRRLTELVSLAEESARSDRADGADRTDRTDRTDRADRSDRDEGVFGLVALGRAPQPLRWSGRAAERPELAVRQLDRTLDRSWQRTSFTRLTSTAGPGGEDDHDRDHDARTATDAASGAPSVGDDDVTSLDDQPVPLAGLPRGAAIGTAVHAVLERLDFAADRQAVAAAVDAGASDVLDESQRRLLADALAGVLTTPLGELAPQRRLADVATGRRLDELTFDLPVAGGYRPTGDAPTLADIARVIERHGGDDPMLARFAQQLRSRPARGFRGFLTGSIDLVAELDGRYLVADYKTNWLGRTGTDGASTSVFADYHPDRLVDAMLAHDYPLQALLYIVALHRYLRLRLGADYDAQRQLAGAAYLFVRGMAGPDTPRTAAGAPYGICVVLPPVDLVDALDELLARGVR